MKRIRSHNPTLRTGALDIIVREYLKDRIAFLEDEFRRSVLAENLEDLARLADRVRSNRCGSVTYGNSKRVDQLRACAGMIGRGEVPSVIGRSSDYFIELARHLADTSCFEMDNNMIIVDEDGAYRIATTNEARHVSITPEGRKMTETVKWNGRETVESSHEGITVITYDEEDDEETKKLKEAEMKRSHDAFMKAMNGEMP